MRIPETKVDNFQYKENRKEKKDDNKFKNKAELFSRMGLVVNDNLPAQKNSPNTGSIGSASGGMGGGLGE